MLTPRAFRLVLKHLDEIDAHFSQKLTRRRPWSETALTSLLADLLDQDTQEESGLSYGLKNLNDDLTSGDSVLRIEFKLETHEYPPHHERWVTQADLGLLIRYNDHFVPRDSWKWLAVGCLLGSLQIASSLALLIQSPSVIEVVP